jgi:hypothetical protein
MTAVLSISRKPCTLPRFPIFTKLNRGVDCSSHRRELVVQIR